MSTTNPDTRPDTIYLPAGEAERLATQLESVLTFLHSDAADEDAGSWFGDHVRTALWALQEVAGRLEEQGDPVRGRQLRDLRQAILKSWDL